MTHTNHPGIKEAGLDDNCERCTEHAEHPFDSLDDSNIAFLAEMVLSGKHARSSNERRAMNTIQHVFSWSTRLEKLGIVW